MKFIKRKNVDTYKPKSQRLTVEVDGRAIINTNKSLTVPIGDTNARPGTGVPGMVRYNNTTGYNDFEVFTGYASWGWEKLRTDRPSDITFTQVGTGDGDGTVESVDITVGGSGYDELSPPAVTFSAPDIGVDTATGTAVVDSSGVVTGIIITNDGSGYLSVPTVTIDPPVVGTTAIGTVILTGDLEYALPIVPVNSVGNLSATNIQVYVENVFQLPGINYTLTQQGSTAYVRFDAPVPIGKPVYVIYGFDR
jgi:hypothetical protein